MNTPAKYLFHPANAREFAATMSAGLAHLTGELRDHTAPATGLGCDDARARVEAVDLDVPLADVGSALDELSRVYLDDAIWFHEPGYAAHLNCPVVIPALLAELYISSVNSSMDTFDQSVGATYIERRLIAWTAQRLGLPESADGIFTSGGTQSNLQALVIARGEALARGAQAAKLRIFTSVDGHFSVQKAARLLGLAPNSVVVVPGDDARRMDPAALRRSLGSALAEGEAPMAVVATAGTTDFGAIDPIPQLAELCGEFETWLHVDAAYGGGLLCSTRRRHLLEGIEHADSVTIDFHKTFFQPVSASAVVVRDGATLRHVGWHADYLNPRDCTNPNQVDKSLQTTRRFDALKLWLTLRMMGADAVGEGFDHAIDVAHEVHRRLRQWSGIEVAGEPGLSTVVFRLVPAGVPRDQLCELNRRARAALYTRGQAMVAGTRHDGEVWLKLTLLNPMASVEDVLGIVESLRCLGAELCAEVA